MHRLHTAQIALFSIMNLGTVFTSIKSNNSKCWLVEVNVHVFVNFILYTRQYQPRVKEPWRVIVTQETTVMRTSVVSASCNYVGESGLSWTTSTHPWWSLSTVAVKSWEPTARVRLNLGCKIVTSSTCLRSIWTSVLLMFIITYQSFINKSQLIQVYSR